MIYCVVPPELEADMFDKLVAYYDDKPDVTVVVDRRTGRERRSERAPVDTDKRTLADRRGRAGPGGFISTAVRDP